MKVNVSVNYHEDVKTLAEYKKGVEHEKLLLHLWTVNLKYKVKLRLKRIAQFVHYQTIGVNVSLA